MKDKKPAQFTNDEPLSGVQERLERESMMAEQWAFNMAFMRPRPLMERSVEPESPGGPSITTEGGTDIITPG